MWNVVAEAYFYGLPEFVSIGKVSHVVHGLEGCGVQVKVPFVDASVLGEPRLEEACDGFVVVDVNVASGVFALAMVHDLVAVSFLVQTPVGHVIIRVDG